VFRTGLAGPLLLLLAEVGALTPFVEFSRGPMALVADGRVCSGLLFSLVVLALLVTPRGTDGARPTTATPTHPRRTARRLALHLGIYLGFVVWTVELSRHASPESVPVAIALGWLLVAATVGGTAFLVFFRLRELGAWVMGSRLPLAVALGCGASLVLVTPWVQGLWARVCPPALAITQTLLRWTFGEGLVGMTAEGIPLLGTRRLVLFVTPQCSELEAIPALWLLGGAVTAVHWREWSRVRVAGALLVGTAVLYLLLAVRLYGLVVAGIEISPKVAVGLAHSRVGDIVFFGLAAAFVSGCVRGCRLPVTGPAPAESPARTKFFTSFLVTRA
jgi:exosortase/archaeosortase family protein